MFPEILTSIAGKVIEAIEDELTDKESAKEKIKKAIESEMQQITERQKYDMMSDSWLSKNIRPLTLIYLMVLFTLAFFYKVPESTLEILKSLLMTAFVFYFGSRTLEKISKIFSVSKLFK